MATILFVEDQIELQLLHATYLRKQGYEVVTAEDGDRALELARLHRPDMIVLDHSIPRRTGIEVARELRADPATASIPIVLMTALAYGAVGQRAREVGCVGYLSKPCLPSRLLVEVRRVIDGDYGPKTQQTSVSAP
jgi:two-component system cell cycle response regulator DivK